MRKNSIKNTRINGEVQRELSNIIRGEIKDPRINPLTSVVAVEVAPDLKTCKAYISVLGDEESQAKTLAGLKSAEGFIDVDFGEADLQRQKLTKPFHIGSGIVKKGIDLIFCQIMVPQIAKCRFIRKTVSPVCTL